MYASYPYLIQWWVPSNGTHPGRWETACGVRASRATALSLARVLAEDNNPGDAMYRVYDAAAGTVVAVFHPPPVFAS